MSSLITSTPTSNSSPTSDPNTDATLRSDILSTPTTTPRGVEGWTSRLKGWWTTYLNWRENVGDDQLACHCSPAQECQCELRMVTAPGPA